MKRLVYVLAVLSVSTSAVLAQEIDDIYYNPKKDKKIETRTQSKRSNYIKNFDSVDIDDYNRRGQYYKSQIDTIGEKAETDPDFVYTQKLQKFYNPTIVVDNKAVLQDVLDNSYGNIDIVYNINGLPSFASYYSPYIYHYGWRNPWYWNGGWDPYWDWAWNPIYGPSWNWGWGPSWSWGPSWNWGWGPSWSWGWGPSWNWGWGPSWSGGWSHNHHANYRPTGRYPNRPSANWAGNTQPGYTTNNRRPSYGIQNNNTFQAGSSVNHKRGYSDYNTNSSSGGYRINSEQSSSSSSKKGYTINSNGHRTYNSNSQENSTSSNRRYTTTENNSSKNSYNFNSTNNRNSSFSNGSFNRGGGYSSGGGGSRGRHR